MGEPSDRLQWLGIGKEKLENGGKYMTEKEKLISEMKNLDAILKECLALLEEGKIDEMTYQRMGEGMFSVTWALQHYLADIPTDSTHTADNAPDIQGMKFE